GARAGRGRSGRDHRRRPERQRQLFQPRGRHPRGQDPRGPGRRQHPRRAPHGRRGLFRRTRPAVVLRAQDPARGDRAGPAVHRAGRAGVQRASARAPHRAGRRGRARGAGAGAVRGTGPRRARHRVRAHRRGTAHAWQPYPADRAHRPLPAPSRVPGRHPPQRQDRTREARRMGGPATGEGPMKVLVTGGGGFLGQALCRALLARGHAVHSFQRSHSPALQAMGVVQHRGDLADAAAVARAVAGMDAVLHNAAKAGAWGSYGSYYQANVVGTRNVIAACRANGVQRLVYTSTPSVTHRATHPVEGLGADEVPYGEDFQAPYAATKAIAEQEALAANGPELAVVALRPRLIWGPGDPQILPRLVERAHAGRLRLVGDGSNLVDTTYIDNAAQAHLDALDRLAPDAACAGKAYFISNG